MGSSHLGGTEVRFQIRFYCYCYHYASPLERNADNCRRFKNEIAPNDFIRI